MASRLDRVKAAADKNTTGLQTLQDDVQRDKAAAEDLLQTGKAAQQVLSELQVQHGVNEREQ